MKQRLAPAVLLFATLLALLSIPAFAGTPRSTLSAPPAGSELLYNLPLTGSGTDYSWANAIDSAGNHYITGMTDSADFPVTDGAFDTSLNDSFDAFVAKIDPAGNLVYATYLGGTALDQGSKIAVDSAGNAYIAGYTYSADFPVTDDAYDTEYAGNTFDAFVVKVNPDGSDLDYATYLGGDGDDYGGGITVDTLGRAYFTGYSESSDFPTTDGAYDTDFNGVGDVVVVKLTADGSDLDYSTFVGGDMFEAAYGIVLDANLNAYLTGHTYSDNFPTTDGAYSTGYNGGLTDAFVLKLLPDGSDLAYSSYLGGDDFDDAKGITINSTAGDIYLAGRTNSLNFPTTLNAFDIDYNGGRDVFVTHLTPNSTGADDLTYSTFLGGGGEDEAGGIGLDPYGYTYVTGWTFSDNFPTTLGAYDPSFNFADRDAFLAKLSLSSSGANDLTYGTFLGMENTNYGRSIAIDSAGTTYITGYLIPGENPADAFALRFAPAGIGVTPTPSVTPTPTITPTPSATPPNPDLYLPIIPHDD